MCATLIISLLIFGGCGFESDFTEKPTNNEQNTNAPLSEDAITLDNIPEYSGVPYVALYDNQPLFSKEDYTTKAFESYSNLDKLGRCGVTFACVGVETMPTEERGSIGQVKPSGWVTAKYDENVEIFVEIILHQRIQLQNDRVLWMVQGILTIGRG